MCAQVQPRLATKLPQPTTVSTSPSSRSSATALRAVVSATPYSCRSRRTVSGPRGNPVARVHGSGDAARVLVERRSWSRGGVSWAAWLGLTGRAGLPCARIRGKGRTTDGEGQPPGERAGGGQGADTNDERLHG